MHASWVFVLTETFVINFFNNNDSIRTTVVLRAAVLVAVGKTIVTPIVLTKVVGISIVFSSNDNSCFNKSLC